MTKALQGIAVMGVIGYVGLMLLAEGRSGSNVQEDTTERVDVNDAETGSNANVVWRGRPYSVVLVKGSYNIGTVSKSDGSFKPLMGSNGLRYAYSTQSAAVAKAEQLNNPTAGGVKVSEPALADVKQDEPYEQVINPTDFGFGSPAPAMGW